MTSQTRSFLFLQGLASWFFDRLGRTLAERGHSVHRVNFNGGDRLFWRHLQA
jgi:capsular polysaccharide export protein